MSDTVEQRAAEVLRSIDKRHPLRHSVQIDHNDDDRIAALAVAGLLADSTTSRTDAEQAVIEAAIAMASHPVSGTGFYELVLDVCAAVDRLAATGPKEASKHDHGLLADPTTSRTDEQQAVINQLARSLRGVVDWADRHRVSFEDHNHYCFELWTIEKHYAALALDAVDRLTANIPNEGKSCMSCGTTGEDSNELITDVEGSVFCEACYQP